MFLRYAEARGVIVDGKAGGDQSRATDTVSVVAAELGVNERTAFRRLAAARLRPIFRVGRGETGACGPPALALRR